MVQNFVNLTRIKLVEIGMTGIKKVSFNNMKKYIKPIFGSDIGLIVLFS